MCSRTKFFWLINLFYLLTWLILAFNVFDRSAWILENVLVVLLVPIAIRAFTRKQISNQSYLLTFVFLLLHGVGAHYTYAQVPYREWLKSIYHFSSERNHYDRFVHFAFGVLLFYPLKEFLKSQIPLTSKPLVLVTVIVIAFCSSTYELLEWLAAIIFNPNLGAAYLGSQGDPWDAQKDHALALLGGVLAASLPTLLTAWPSLRKFTSNKSAM